MHDVSFQEAVERICQTDSRYDPDAYYFLREALDFVTKTLKKPHAGQGRHVSGQELLDGIRIYTLQEFGPMSLTVLHTWGLHRTADIGELVFNLVEAGKLGKTEEDTKQDFADVFDFDEAFGAPFEPQTPAGPPASRRT